MMDYCLEVIGFLHFPIADNFIPHFSDISATTAFLRAQHLDSLLDRTDLHHRLFFATCDCLLFVDCLIGSSGSDYPVPAVWIVVWTSKLQHLGLITSIAFL